MERDEFTQVSLDAQERCLRRPPGSDWFAAEVENAVVFITPDWTVLICAKKLINCVSAFSVVLSSIVQELNAPIAITLPRHQNEDDEPLHRVLQREAQMDFARRVVVWVLGITIAGVVGTMFQCLAL